MFYTITNLQGSQTLIFHPAVVICFTPLQTYKVLKPMLFDTISAAVLHHYKLTRFSNLSVADLFVEMFYTITNLQGSQTNVIVVFIKF